MRSTGTQESVPSSLSAKGSPRKASTRKTKPSHSSLFGPKSDQQIVPRSDIETTSSPVSSRISRAMQVATSSPRSRCPPTPFHLPRFSSVSR